MCVCAMLIIKQNNKVPNNIASSSREFENKSIIKHNVKQNQSYSQMTVTLFSNVHLVLLLISDCVFFFGAAVIYTHLTAFAKSQGMSSSLRN